MQRCGRSLKFIPDDLNIFRQRILNNKWISLVREDGRPAKACVWAKDNVLIYKAFFPKRGTRPYHQPGQFCLPKKESVVDIRSEPGEILNCQALSQSLSLSPLSLSLYIYISSLKINCIKTNYWWTNDISKTNFFVCVSFSINVSSGISDIEKKRQEQACFLLN